MAGVYNPKDSAGKAYLAGIHAAHKAAREAGAPAAVSKAIRKISSDHVNRDRSGDRIAKKPTTKKSGK